MDLLPGLRDEHAGGSKRGRPPSALRLNVYRLNEKCNKTMWWTSEESQTGVRDHGESNKMQCTSPPEFTPAEIIIIWRQMLEDQAEALVPDSFVELMSFRPLLVFLNARCGDRGAKPHRHILGGRVLTEYADLNFLEQRDNVRAIQNRSGVVVVVTDNTRQRGPARRILVLRHPSIALVISAIGRAANMPEADTIDLVSEDNIFSVFELLDSEGESVGLAD
ncbi:hypothetical protein JG687_00012514 [Phytophthora cactorum]|uniref:Uncharacterized protein n=1 Tax=Phytophthora cactorum TaxID=29920 RepID=A0A8T1U431_9STRA|nr:hypothetical protein GQ600_19870 [Phytophthora cactorum]KAG6953221.1 hypothetical protein JG687_00012514 [Phytophthora cactorum]